MLLVVVCWVVAMVSGLLWPRTAVAVFSIITAAVFLLTRQASLAQGFWVELLVIVATPWLLSQAATRYRASLKKSQEDAVARRVAIEEDAKRLSAIQQDNRLLEENLSHLGEIYRVTKEASRGLHAEEIFAASLEHISRLLAVKDIRLVDVSEKSASVHRATRSSDGRLVMLPAVAASALQDLEKSVMQKLSQSPWIAAAAASELGGNATSGTTITAAALLREQQPVGALIAENLPPHQRQTFQLIANQLSLQLARVVLYRQVEALAVTDALTGLSVRGHFLQRADQEVDRCIHHKLSCTVLMIDLDFFKQKNDLYGHLVGDLVLREVSRLLQHNLREVDLIGRYGGEEIVLLLLETAVEQALPIAQRLKQLVELHPIRAYDELLTQTVSIGLAGFPEEGKNLQQLLERADQALYAAKRAGRNRVVRWTQSLNT